MHCKHTEGSFRHANAERTWQPTKSLSIHSHDSIDSQHSQVFSSWLSLPLPRYVRYLDSPLYLATLHDVAQRCIVSSYRFKPADPAATAARSWPATSAPASWKQHLSKMYLSHGDAGMPMDALQIRACISYHTHTHLCKYIISRKHNTQSTQVSSRCQLFILFVSSSVHVHIVHSWQDESKVPRTYRPLTKAMSRAGDHLCRARLEQQAVTTAMQTRRNHWKCWIVLDHFARNSQWGAKGAKERGTDAGSTRGMPWVFKLFSPSWVFHLPLKPS